jgi:hypothetical protein
MTQTLAITLNSLNLPALTKADHSALRSLQREWDHHTARLGQLDPDRILGDQKSAYQAFLADPSDENEQRLAVLADERLTARRHALLRQAHAELRQRTNGKAAIILRPAMESAQHALTRELEARQETLRTTGLNHWHDDRCIELRWAMDQVALGLNTLGQAAANPQGAEVPPLELATVLLDIGIESPGDAPDSSD